MSNVQIELANGKLNRIHEEFERLAFKGSAILAINLSMLALVALNYPATKHFEHTYLIGLLPILTIVISMVYLYRSQYPDFKGTKSSTFYGKSLFYYREISQLSENEFATKFLSLSETEATKEILSQVWRVSSVLTQQYNYLKWAIIWTTVSSIPWLFVLGFYAWQNSKIIVNAC